MEKWKPIPGFEDLYSASTHGRVMRTGKGGAAQPGKIISAQTDPQGYIRLNLCRNYERHSVKVHRVIASTFLGPIPAGWTVNHKNGVKSDNRVENLEIVTRGKNISHAFQVIKTQTVRGEKNPRATITEAQALQIRIRLLAGERGCDLAKEFGTNKYIVSNIKRGRTWTHLGA